MKFAVSIGIWKWIDFQVRWFCFLPIGSMYGIFSYIYHKHQLNVGKYTIHGFYGLSSNVLFFNFLVSCWTSMGYVKMICGFPFWNLFLKWIVWTSQRMGGLSHFMLVGCNVPDIQSYHVIPTNNGGVGWPSKHPQPFEPRKKHPPTFHYSGWLIGILIMAYYNPYITG